MSESQTARVLDFNPTEMISAELDGELSPAEQARAGRLSAKSAALRSDAEAFRQVDLMLLDWADEVSAEEIAVALGGLDAPPDAPSSEARPMPRRRRGWWAVAAAVLLVLSLGLVKGRTEAPRPSEDALTAAILEMHTTNGGATSVLGQPVRAHVLDDGLGAIAIYEAPLAADGEQGLAALGLDRCELDFEMQSCSWTDGNRRLVAVSAPGDAALSARLALMMPELRTPFRVET